MFIDAHAHLNDKRLLDNLSEVRSSYLSCDVDLVINSGYDLQSSYVSKEVSEKFDEVYFTAGVHPDSCKTFNSGVYEEIKNLALHKKCVAIGETGVDLHFEPENEKIQLEVFDAQINIASELKLPVVVHSRDACKLTYDFIKERLHLLQNGFLLHCFSESAEVAKEYVKIGAYFSFGGVTTFKNAKKDQVIKNIPMDKILTETDCPYMAPVPYRGTLNEPKYVSIIAQKIAEFYSVSTKEFALQVKQNAKTLFKKLAR